MNKDLLQEELTRGESGAAESVSPLVAKLDGYRIMSDTVVPEEDFLMKMFGRPCFPRSDLSAITGAEKCGKTVFTSMIMAAAAAEGKVLELERSREERLRVMWYDTEQCRTLTKGILTQRVMQMIGHTESTEISGHTDETDFLVFNVRALTWQERMECLAEGIKAYKPDIVIVDNVCDLISNINEADECIQLIERLMQLAATYNCNISVVIHLNRSGEKRSLRGWLGTEILHKAFEVYCCKQVEETDVLMVEQALTRKYKIAEELYYIIDDQGLPQLTEKPNVQGRDKQGRYQSNKPEAYQVLEEKVRSFCQDYIIHNGPGARLPWEWDLKRLFSDAMGSRAEMGLEDLRREVMRLSRIEQPKYYDKVFRMAIDRRVVQTTMDRMKRVVVIPVCS